MPNFYYGLYNQFTPTYQIEPAPNISIQTQFSYSNDNLHNYSYLMSINGTAIKRDSLGNMRNVLGEIEHIKEVFARNGSNLTIRNGSDNMLRAKGGTLKTISFDTSSNNWVHSCPYTVSIEFNELEILDETFLCNDTFIDSSTNSSYLIDLEKYKIKEFNDSWNIEVNENTHSHMFGHTLLINNSEITLSYSLSATGKNYYINDQLMPAYQHAKNFVQHRLYDQTRALSKVLTLNGDSCDAIRTLDNLHQNVTDAGILSGITNNYVIYNETLTLSASESDGTFSAEYKCILKENSDGDYHSANVKHTVNKTNNHSRNGAKNNRSININGEVTGYCEGGILQNFGTFTFPSSGTILQANSTSTKYQNALAFLPKIINGDDLLGAYKTALGVGYDELEIPGGDCGDSSLNPSSFSLTHNFMNGVITYGAEYNTDRSCVQEFAEGTVFSTTIDVEEPVPVLAEFTVPNGNYIIQDIGTITARKVNVVSQGRKNMDHCYTTDLVTFIQDVASSDIETMFPFLVLPDEEIYILTSKNFNYNILDGSYTVNLSYICQSGCEL